MDSDIAILFVPHSKAVFYLESLFMKSFKHSLLFSLIFVTPLAFAASDVQTGKNDQKQVSLTIYERDLALVRDVRQVPLQNGTVKVRFVDVSERIQPETVMLKDQSSGRISVAQIYFDNNLLTPQTLLESYVGKKVKVIKTNRQQVLKRKSRLKCCRHRAGSFSKSVIASKQACLAESFMTIFRTACRQNRP